MTVFLDLSIVVMRGCVRNDYYAHYIDICYAAMSVRRPAYCFAKYISLQTTDDKQTDGQTNSRA